MAKSPSITILEQDNSSYTVTTSTTILAIIGYATRGKIGEPVLVTSKGELKEKFGTAPVDSPYGMLAAYRAFNQTDKIIYYRVADRTSGDSDKATLAERVITGGDSDRIRILAKEEGSAFNSSSIAISTNINPITGDSYYNIKFYYKGELKESFNDISWNVNDANFFKTIINKDSDNGGSKYINIDTYQKASGDSLITIPGGTYLLGAPNSGDTAGNKWSTGDTWTNYSSGDSTYYTYRAGTDGVTGDTSIGDSIFVSALSTAGHLGNKELWDFHILITPGNYSAVVENAAITLAENRLDFFYIADPPTGLDYSAAVSWHNGTGSGRTAAFNTSYAATYWDWQKEYNPDSSEYIWVGPSSFVAEAFLYTDRLFAPWYAPAGDKRGVINSYETASSPSFAQREVMYGDLNAINPIVNFNAKGIEIYGQKTLLRSFTALNRVNVRRMVIYIKKLAKINLNGIVFEPHNADSWAKATNILNSILEPIRQDNGLSDYKVVIDSTINTADIVAQGIMKGYMQIVPTGTIEIIEIPIKIDQAGATIA